MRRASPCRAAIAPVIAGKPLKKQLFQPIAVCMVKQAKAGFPAVDTADQTSRGS
jgi:hypothetical protein